jgi:3-hydroxypropanoate dehydrogenase
VSQPINETALNQIFREARTRNGWAPGPIPETDLHAIYDLAKMGPTSANMSPARFVWVTSQAGKETLASLSSSTNADKILAAPCTVVIGYDLDFPETLPKLFPHNLTAKDWFGDPGFRQEAAFRNSSLQGAYFIIAARAMGYDCGPMSGFNNAGVDAAFFEGTNMKSNFICCIGKGTDENLFARSPRLTFEEAGRIV